MNPKLAMCRIYIPSRVRLAKLSELIKLTAYAFEMEMPDISDKSFKDCLRSYATFTANAARGAYFMGRDIPKIQNQLFQSGKEFGHAFRKILHIKGANQGARAIEILYAAMGIDLKCLTDNRVIISRCFFSEYYDSRTCEIISALDSGIVAGLADCDSLTFSERITEGHETCAANMSYAKDIR